MILVASMLVACSDRSSAIPIPSSEPATPGFCADWFRLATESSKFGAPPGSLSKPADLRRGVESTTAYLQALASIAPPDIQPDFETYAE